VLALVLLAPGAASATGIADAVSVWSELARITGVQAAGLAAYTITLAARHRGVTAAFGIDGALGLHRATGTATVALVGVHIVAVLLDDPANIALLHPLDAPARAAAGVGACVTLTMLVALAAARHRVVPIPHDVWRWGHQGLATAAGALAVLHVAWVDRLIHSPLWAAWMALLLLASAAAMVARWVWRPAQAARFMVRDIRALTPDVSTVVLTPLDRFDFRAGQFAWLRLSRWRTDTDHPFTMSSSPHDPHLEFTVRHRGDWTTGALRAVRPGHTVWLDGPHGAMTLDRAGPAGIVMVAAGVGVAPMMSMLRTMAHRGDRRPVWLIVPPVHLHAVELHALAAVLDLTICPVLRRPLSADLLGGCLPGPPDMRGLSAYVCGPPTMVDDAVAALVPLGIPQRLVYTERFDR